MAISINVVKKKEGEFRVTISEGTGQTSHSVTVSTDYHQKLTGGKVSAEGLVRRSFEFLLQREPKESILSEFDLPVIAHYFPDYEREIKKRLRG